MKETDKLEKRDFFRSRFGFILACVGSAVGMGNIWLFPYRVGQFGGAAFLIPYIIFLILLGFTGVVGEISLGRAMETGPLGAFKKALDRRGKNWGEIVGMIPVIGATGIAVGYTVVVGWITKFALQSLTGQVTASSNSGQFFGEIAGPYGSLIWHIAAIILIALIMFGGIAEGIEKVNKVMMPLFFLMFIFIAIRVFFLDGAMEGYKFIFKPDFEKMMNVKTWVFALGQAFFSLSLAGSGTVVYGSYLKKDEDVINASKHIVIFDTIAALLAALVIIPSVFVYLGPNNLNAGPPLMFITMPEIFKQMPLGRLFSSIFFIAVLFAGVTSLINLFETPIEALQEKFKFSRIKSVSIILTLGFICGIVLEDGSKLGDWMDLLSLYVIPIGALLAGLIFYWVCGDDFAYEQINLGREQKIGRWIIPVGKYLFCGLTLFVVVAGIFYKGIG